MGAPFDVGPLTSIAERLHLFTAHLLPKLETALHLLIDRTRSARQFGKGFALINCVQAEKSLPTATCTTL